MIFWHHAVSKKRKKQAAEGKIDKQEKGKNKLKKKRRVEVEMVQAASDEDEASSDGEDQELDECSSACMLCSIFLASWTHFVLSVGS